MHIYFSCIHNFYVIQLKTLKALREDNLAIILLIINRRILIFVKLEWKSFSNDFKTIIPPSEFPQTVNSLSDMLEFSSNIIVNVTKIRKKASLLNLIRFGGRLYNKFCCATRKIYIYIYYISTNLLSFTFLPCLYNFIQPLRAENGRSTNMHVANIQILKLFFTRLNFRWKSLMVNNKKKKKNIHFFFKNPNIFEDGQFFNIKLNGRCRVELCSFEWIEKYSPCSS